MKATEAGENHEARMGVARSMAVGAVGFAAVGICGFAAWAVFGQWLGARIGEAGLYGVCALVFVGLAGLLLHPLMRGRRRVARFYGVFIPAFLAYAVAWCAAWFVLHFGWGEWLGSLAGCVAFAGVACWRLGNGRSFLAASAVLFVLHSAGYFLGGMAMHGIAGAGGADGLGGLSKSELWMAAKLAWGFLYGLGFGAGIGYGFFAGQSGRVR